MHAAGDILKAARTIIVVDWPSRDVPETLSRAGYTTIVKGGPEPDNYSVYELRGGEVVARRLDRAPEQADLVYVHRPLDELAQIVSMAVRMSAKGIWYQSGLAQDGTRDPQGCWIPNDSSQQASRMVESAGLSYVDNLYIANAVRQLG
jgi:predicted CoA-binding protein